ncbi:MAG: hypothetical protein DRJ50_13910 [Actinobacteria bacterium]|nr:MAG: hypothetical protein DRJ50_13910 [Actinomycetota bacterium]
MRQESPKGSRKRAWARSGAENDVAWIALNAFEAGVSCDLRPDLPRRVLGDGASRWRVLADAGIPIVGAYEKS